MARPWVPLGMALALGCLGPATVRAGHPQEEGGGAVVGGVPFFVSPPTPILGAAPPIFVVWGPNGPRAVAAPLVIAPVMKPVPPPPVPVRTGRVAVPGQPDLVLPPERVQGRKNPAAGNQREPERMKQLITRGDRLFRARNYKRARDRYTQALDAAPEFALPRVRLAQLALAYGDYREAANMFREAITAQPDWLINAPDIQAMYAEPGDFARVIGRLESHLQAEPEDRDAWLALGVERYLSGKTRQAADIFLRLTDRRVDPTLQALLDAATPEPRPAEPARPAPDAAP